MKRLLILTTIALAVLTATAQVNELPRSNPAAEGVEPQAIERMVDTLMALPGTDIHHLMVLRHGKVIAEAHPAPFVAANEHTLYSCSKTVTALAVGKLIDQGRLSLDARVARLLPDKCPDSISPALASMTVHHLLIMGSGLTPSLDFMTSSNDWVRHWLAGEVTEQGRFRYDSMCTFTLAAIVQRITGMTLLEFVNEHFFNPMHITVADWETGPDGVNTAGWGLRLQTESLAKIGLLIMQRGRWNDRQLVSEHWIDLMTTKHNNYKFPGDTPTDTNQGYCYQMWRCLQPDAVRADGAYGQFIIVMPKLDMVVVMCGMSTHTALELAAVWNQLVPGVKNHATPSTGLTLLERKLKTLALPVVEGERGSLEREQWLRHHSVPVDSNARNVKTVTVAPRFAAYELQITKNNGKSAFFTLPFATWGKQQKSTMAPPYHSGAMPLDLDTVPGLRNDWLVSGHYAWPTDDTLVMRLYWVNWIAATTITVHFHPDGTATATLTDSYP